jgi:hypothetical protein
LESVLWLFSHPRPAYCGAVVAGIAILLVGVVIALILLLGAA